MGVVLKLQLTTWIFWSLFPWPFWAWLLPSQDMATVMDMVMVMAMVDMVTMDTMVRGQLMLNLLLLPSPDMDMVMDTVMDMSAMAMVVMVIKDTMAKDLLKLSPDMAMDMVMDMDMDMAMDMVAMDTMDIMARGPLMP